MSTLSWFFMEPLSDPWGPAEQLGVEERGDAGAGHPCCEFRHDLLVSDHPLTSVVLPAPAASATLTWRSPTSAPWTGSCWAPRPRPARRPSGSVALPSRPPSSPPGTTSGSSSTRTPPAPARPRASVSPTSEVTPMAGHAYGLPRGGGGILHLPPPRRVSPSTQLLEPSVGTGTGHIAVSGCLETPQDH